MVKRAVFVRVVELWEACVEISAYVKEPTGGQNYQQCYPAPFKALYQQVQKKRIAFFF